MKRVLSAAVIVSMLLTVLFIPNAVSANPDDACICIDRIGVNDNTSSTANSLEDHYEIEEGDRMYVLGWAYSAGTQLETFAYTVNGGANIVCPGTYRDRPDVANALGLDPDCCIGAGIGTDNDMLELAGINELPVGIYEIVLKAVFKNGTEIAFDSFKITLVVSGGSDPAADTLVIAVDGGGEAVIAEPGEEVDVKIRFINNESISSAKISLHYCEKLSVVTDGKGRPKANVDIYDPDDETARKAVTLFADSRTLLINWLTVTGEVRGDAVFATVRFKVSDDAQPGEFLAVTADINPNDVYDKNQVNVPYGLVDGGISVTSVPGDPDLPSDGVLYNIDRLTVNESSYTGQTPGAKETRYEIAAGDRMYINGWAVYEGTQLDRIVYTVNGGRNINCRGPYIYRQDVSTALHLSSETGVGAGFGSFDEFMELPGINELPAGTYDIEIKAVFKDGTIRTFDKANSLGVFTLVVEGGGQGTDPGTQYPPIDPGVLDEEKLNIVIDGGFGELYAEPGKTVQLKIRVINNASLSSLKMRLEYSDKLTILTDSRGRPKVVFDIYDPEDRTAMKSAQFNNDGRSVNLNWLTTEEEVVGDAVYATLTFTVSEDAEPGEFLPVTAYINPNNVFDKNQKNVEFNLINGGVAVKAHVHTPGQIESGDNGHWYRCVDCGEIIEIEEHSFDLVETVDATCTEDGYSLYRCSVCGYERRQIIHCAGHMFGYDNVCDICGYTVTAHEHSFTETVVEPTCTSMGYTEYVCDCGFVYRDNLIEPLGHKWNGGEITKERTCTEDGLITYTCTVCGDTVTETVSAGHDWNEEIIRPATCTTDGFIVKTCKNCEYFETEVIPASHKWGETKYTHDPDCTHDGKCEHTCAACGITEEFDVPALGHEFHNGICVRCGIKYTEIITEHPEHALYGMYFSLDDIVSAYGPNTINEYGVLLDVNEDAVIDKVAVYLIQDGTMWRRAIACVGTNIRYATFVPYLSYNDDVYYSGLNSSMINTFSLSQGSDGIWRYGDYTTIGANLEDRYGNLLLSLHDIAQTGAKTRIFDDLAEMKAWLLGAEAHHEHEFCDWYSVIDPTCTEEGLEEHTCTICGHTEQRTVKPLGHKPGKIACDGENHWHICSSCGEIIDIEAHILDKNVCTVCGFTVKIKGDCNGDGALDNKDVVLLFRYVSANGTDADPDVFDFNGDGSIDNKDVVALFRFLSR